MNNRPPRTGSSPSAARRPIATLPCALEHLDDFRAATAERRPAVFLDYDGTLTPIVARPEDAVLDASMRRRVEELAARCPVAVVSGRDRPDVEKLVGLENLWYAGSHGFDIAGPGGRQTEYQQGADYLPALDRAETELRRALENLPGAQVERKKFALAVHFRRVAAAEIPRVERAVDAALETGPGLRKTGGKKIFELRPDLDWDKGKAVAWLLRELDLNGPEILPVYVGDDLTDEDAFRELHDRGIGILVPDAERWTWARYTLADPPAVGEFLGRLAKLLEARG